MSLLCVCVAVFLIPLACRSRPESAASLEEPQTVAGQTDGGTPEDTDWVGIDPNDGITSRREVASKYEALDGKRVLRFKTDLVAISANVQDVIEYFEKHSTEYPNLTDEKALADKLRSEQGVRSEYRFEDFLPGERDRLYFCVATLLEEGSFLITLNETGQRVPRIQACKYSHIRGPMDGYAGRSFLLEDGREFFGTMDRIY